MVINRPPTLESGLSKTMKRNISISGVLLLAFALSIHAQTPGVDEAFPKLLSLRDQQTVREGWLKTRLDTMLLPMMRQKKVEMWIVTNEEFHADPVTAHIAPPLPYVGRRDFFVFADR